MVKSFTFIRQTNGSAVRRSERKSSVQNGTSISTSKPPSKIVTNSRRRIRAHSSIPIGKKVTEIAPKKKQSGAMLMIVGNKTFKISAKILKEINYYQATPKTLIPKLPFTRLIQEIIMEYAPAGIRVQREALEAIQEAAECYITQYFEDSYACALHSRRSTLIPRDMELVQFLRKSF